MRSIVGRYLEHSRICRFGEPGAEDTEYVIGSADLMPRNLDRRVEAMLRVTEPRAAGAARRDPRAQPRRRRARRGRSSPTARGEGCRRSRDSSRTCASRSSPSRGRKRTRPISDRDHGYAHDDAARRGRDDCRCDRRCVLGFGRAARRARRRRPRAATIPKTCTRRASRPGACDPTCGRSGDFVDAEWADEPPRRAAVARRRARRGARHRGAARPAASDTRSSFPTREQDDAERVVRRLVADWEAARTRMVETLAGDAVRGLARPARRGRGRIRVARRGRTSRATRFAPTARAPPVAEAAKARSTSWATIPADDALHAVAHPRQARSLRGRGGDPRVRQRLRASSPRRWPRSRTCSASTRTPSSRALDREDRERVLARRGVRGRDARRRSRRAPPRQSRAEFPDGVGQGAPAPKLRTWL